MNGLAERVQSLTAELYVMIYELTFAKNSDTQQITSEYKPTSRVSVDRASRAESSLKGIMHERHP